MLERVRCLRFGVVGGFDLRQSIVNEERTDQGKKKKDDWRKPKAQIFLSR